MSDKRDKEIEKMQRRIKELETALRKETEKNRQLQDAIKQKDELAAQTSELVNHFATGKLMRLNHLMFRVNGQMVHGSKEDRSEFRSWLGGRIKKTNRTLGEGVKYNPWMVVDTKLQEMIQCTPYLGTPRRYDSLLAGSEVFLNADTYTEDSQEQMLDEGICNVLKQKYTKSDIIFLSVIDYDFRYQRPQQFATRFAENGHRVFYVNANFVRPDSVKPKNDRLNIVDFRCLDHNAIYTMQGEDTLNWMKEKFNALVYEYAIRDAVVVVDYPNWVYGAEYMRKEFGFKIVTDYMDDFTGFLGTAEDFLKDNCIRLLKSSDLVVTSSQFLFEVAQKYTSEDKIAVIRNGTETDHFYQAYVPEGQKKEKERKVIGYYGAVAHWFAWEKVVYLAKNLPDCDIVIIGEVTEHKDKLESCKNIKLLGEKKYQDLPEYLVDFDVCLIPFDTSTDLIKATNPVKFYEYLSAGKKVVATQIPELEPFKDQYVYMANDDKLFLDAVVKCLNGEDTLAGQEECVEFARENDWQKRYEAFAEACGKKVPLVSIIVLTYNNLEYNKNCIRSILDNTAYANYELIIVDNLSTDGTREYLEELQKQEIPNVKIILNDKNSGFAGGNNLGMKEAKGKYVLLLNNDTVVTRGWITNMVKHMENDEQIGMCGSVTNSIGNEAKIRVNYTDETQMHEFAYAYTALHMGEEFTGADRLAMFCTLIRADIIEEFGGLDERYAVGMFEDDDYAQVVTKAGKRLVVAEDAFVHHINNGSFGKMENSEYRKIFDANKKKFEEKWNTTWQMPHYREGVTADCNLKAKI